MTNELSPRPWRVNSVTGGHISDANGDPVCFCVGSCCGYKAAVIVDAVNNADSWRDASIKARTERNAFLLERDRLRDLVKRLVTIRETLVWRKDEKTGLMYYDRVIDEEFARKTIEEAKAAIKWGEK